MSLDRGVQLGRYEILAPLGKGGMGEVYRAKDVNLDREVAIKVLPEHLAQDPVALKRFEREAKAVASLSHPNILDIHDSGSDRGIVYAVTELLEGKTLRAGLQDASISVSRALEIAAAVAEGIAAAHTKGVVHRDLKPENIFLTKDGRVKILDFGLARLDRRLPQDEVTEAPTKSQVTAFGMVMGTVPYMSPEQVRGEPVDGRSDIFSLGCILYEMLAGTRPFSGSTTAEITAGILKDEPARIAKIAPEVQRLIERCLQKNPDHRFHSAHDLAFALMEIFNTSGSIRSTALKAPRTLSRSIWIAAAVLAMIGIVVGWKMIGLRKKGASESPVQKIGSLAVLPLKNLSGDAKQEYFADGMTEELIAKLARIASLRVISRTSVMEYKDAHKPLPEIAKELNVEAIVEGSVLQAGDRVRITAQLIHAATDRHLWADSYERELRDILTLQNEVASAIAKEVQVKLAPEEAAQLASAPRVNPQAYQAYLRGINYSESEVTEENVRLTVEMFQKAVDLDSNFALAYAELSRAQSFLYFTFDHNQEWLVKSKAALDRAFELQPGFAEGHIALGYYYYRGFRDYDRALQELMTAQKTLPNNKTILTGKGAIYRRQGRFEEALAVFQKLLAMNPRHAPTAYDVGITYCMMRKYPEAQRYFDLSISLGPDEQNGYEASAQNLIRWKADINSAREILMSAPMKNSPGILQQRIWVEITARRYQAALDLLSSPNSEPLSKLVQLGIVHRFQNKPELSRASFETARKRLEKDLRGKPEDYNLHSLLGITYAGLEQKEAAIREGKRAVELLPVSKDAMWGPGVIVTLAFIYVLVGEENAAIDQIEYLLSIPSGVSVPLLRIDPRWDPLRKNRRFQKLLES